MLIHDGLTQGRETVEPIHDKRLWVIEGEFAKLLNQAKRDGNTLSAARTLGRRRDQARH